MYVPASAHSPPMPAPAMKRYKPNAHTLCAVDARPVKTENVKIVAAKIFVRPKRSASGPQMNANPQPARKRGKRIKPANPRLPGVAANRDLGKGWGNAGGSTSAYMNE